MDNKSKINGNKKPIVLSADEKTALQKLNQFRIMSDTEVPEEEYVFTVQGVGCMPIGDLSAIKAAPKKGKTTVLKWICATALKKELGQLSSFLNNPLILWVDTEQKMGDAKMIIEDIKKATGLHYKYLDKHLRLYSLRKTDCKTMLDQVLVAIKAYRPKIVVIDGIAEFVESVNDETEAKNLIHHLMVASEEYYCAIICVLHENRSGTGDMKGHLGSQLTQKVGNVLECKKNGNVITTLCTDSRHQGTPEWSIRFDEYGNIVDANGYESPIQRNARPSNKINKKHLADAEEKKARLDFCQNTIREHNGSLAKKDLTQLLIDKKGISRSRASALLTEFINENHLLNDKNIITLPPSNAALS